MAFSVEFASLRGGDRPFNGSPFTCYCGCRLAAVKSTALKTIYQTSHTNLDAAEFRPQKLGDGQNSVARGRSAHHGSCRDHRVLSQHSDRAHSPVATRVAAGPT